MIAVLIFFSQAGTSATPFEVPEVPDAVLAEQRGGVRLPNGIDLALSVQTQSAVDGAIVLQTVFSIDTGPATTTAYVPRDGQSVPAVAAAPGTSGLSTQPRVTFDSRSGLQVTPGSSAIPVSIGGVARQLPADIPAGLEKADLTAPVRTSVGALSRTGDSLQAIILSTPDLQIAHFAGNAFGSAIANSGSDREITTTTSISIDLSNAGPDVIGSTMLRVEDVALGALGSRL